MLRSLVLATALALGGTLAAPLLAQTTAGQQAPAVVATPEQVVEGIAHDLNVEVAGHQAELAKNKEKLISVINQIFLPHFDVNYASILVLGMHARTATPEQRAEFAQAFYNSITRRYAEGLLDYTKGSVRVLPFNGALNDQRTVVRTVVTMSNGKTVSVDYAFRKTQSGEWKAYDVIIEGISYITNYRNQVDLEIRKIGLDQLIKNLQTQGAQALKSMDQDSQGQ